MHRALYCGDHLHNTLLHLLDIAPEFTQLTCIFELQGLAEVAAREQSEMVIDICQRCNKTFAQDHQHHEYHQHSAQQASELQNELRQAGGSVNLIQADLSLQEEVLGMVQAMGVWVVDRLGL